jgi:HD-like signal output (HDOD) protein
MLERDILGYDHAQIGGFLAVQWKLPPKLGDAIANHHSPAQSIGGNPLTHIIHLADVVARRTFGQRFEGGELQAASDSLVFLTVAEEDVYAFDDKLREEYVKAETFMAMAGISSGPAEAESE